MCISVQEQAIDYKLVILTLSLIISNGITIFLYLKNRSISIDNSISDRLIKLQDISFNNPFLEDKKFIRGWIEFCNNYRSDKYINYEDIEVTKYLQYEQYCEMLFNFMSISFKNVKSEDKILDKVGFKEWARTHKSWWLNPLDEHSNHDTYDKKFCDMVDQWIK